MALKKEFKIGLFVIIVLIATFVVINILRGTDIFGKNITLSSRFDDVESLVESAPVMIRGYAAGRVDKVVYVPQEDNFLVECSIDKRFRIPVDSRMTLFSTSIMGGKGIRIDLGSSDTLAADGACLSSASDSDLISALADGISPLLDRINTMIDSLTRTVGGVNAILDEENRERIAGAIAHLEGTLASANSLSDEIKGKSKDITNIVTKLSQLSDQLAPLSESAGKTLENVERITGEIATADMGGTIENINETIKDINGLVDNLNQPLSEIICDADSLINDIKKCPKKYIKITIF